MLIMLQLVCIHLSQKRLCSGSPLGPMLSTPAIALMGAMLVIIRVVSKSHIFSMRSSSSDIAGHDIRSILRSRRNIETMLARCGGALSSISTKLTNFTHSERNNGPWHKMLLSFSKNILHFVLLITISFIEGLHEKYSEEIQKSQL